MTDALETLARNKLICTGVAMDYEQPVRADRLPSTESEFDELVTQYYRLFREGIRAEVNFLRSVENSPLIASFDLAVYRLRTAKQHSDNPSAKIFYEEWTRNRSWEEAAGEFLAASVIALAELGRISLRVRRDTRLAKTWKDHASVEPESIFDSICRDLNVRFSHSHRQKLLRNVNHRRERLGFVRDVRKAVEQLCVREISTAEEITLPVPHYEILDRLNLMGKREARAALLVAYSVCATTSLTGEAFLDRVEKTWQVGSS